MGNDNRHETVTTAARSGTHPVPPSPNWSLADLFPSKDSPQLADAFVKLEADADAFAARYQDKITKLSGAKLAKAIAEYEDISERAARIHAFATLSMAVNHGDATWAENMQERVRSSTEKTLFLPLEINKIKEADLIAKIAAPELAHYASWIGNVRAFLPHQLDAPQEAFIHNKTPISEGAWGRLYDMTISDLRFNVQGNLLTDAETFNLINNAVEPSLRREALAEYTRVLGDNEQTFGLIFNTVAALKKMGDEWRAFEDPQSSRHLSNQIEPEIVDTMVKTVRESYPRTSHRYYAWKAKKFKTSRLHLADRNAPLQESTAAPILWDDAKKIILDAFRTLSPDIADIAQKFFDNGWIDAEPRVGKDSGSFCHQTVPSVHPYISMNYFGTPADVMTLAHELGKGVHQVLAASQGHLKSETPITIAETASVFAEMLVFKSLLAQEEDLFAKRALIAAKVEDMLNTVTRQTALYQFEHKLHSERRDKGEVSSERIGEIWIETQKESLGSAVNLDVTGADKLWMVVPHFVHTPFYVYAYAFGDCLVNALYDTYEKTADKKDFVDKYTDLLKAGGSKRHDTALAEFDIDATDPKFWKKGLSVIERYIDDLESLDRQIDKILASKSDFKQAANDIVEKPNREKKPRKVAGGPKKP